MKIWVKCPRHSGAYASCTVKLVGCIWKGATWMALPRCMPGTVGRWTLLVFGISAAPALAGHLPICRAGQFIVDQQLPLTAQGNEPLLVVLSHRRVSLGSICGPARAHLRHRKAGTALRVVWRSCRGAASVRLKAILTHSCWDLSGIIDVRRPRARADLTATSRSSSIGPARSSASSDRAS